MSFFKVYNIPWKFMLSFMSFQFFFSYESKGFKDTRFIEL